MANASCSHWWHAPIYITLSISLALIAISSFSPSTIPSTANDAVIFSTNASAPSSDSLKILHNASSTLRDQNYTIIAALLELSPDLFFSHSSTGDSTTVFALPDSAISNSSLPHWARKLLLQYHTVPSLSLPFKSLLRKSSNTCLATAIPSKNIALTKIRPQERLIEINHARISHPDLFLSGPISIHGVLAPFTRLDSQEIKHYTLDFIQSPVCIASSVKTSPHWGQIIRVLSRNDFISFAVGLNSVLEGIIRDYPDLNSGTIFAPKELGSLDLPEATLSRVVRYHILPERYEFFELSSLPEKTKLRTLLTGKDLEITSAIDAVTTQTVVIGGVNVTKPDVCSTKAFVVHKISRAFSIKAHSGHSS